MHVRWSRESVRMGLALLVAVVWLAVAVVVGVLVGTAIHDMREGRRR